MRTPEQTKEAENLVAHGTSGVPADGVTGGGTACQGTTQHPLLEHLTPPTVKMDTAKDKVKALEKEFAEANETRRSKRRSRITKMCF